MPIAFYRGMSDADVRAIVAYLRSVKPIRNKAERSTYKIPLPPYGPPVIHVAEVPRANKLAYGHYLASGLGHCLDCHTPILPTGQSDMSRLGAGGNELPGPGNSVVMSSNLTPGNPKGIASWTDAQVHAAIRTGHRPDGTSLVGPMAFAWYQHISDADLGALVAYLRTLKPIKTD
jgi:mono/diheme cytochrome c family protein